MARQNSKTFKNGIRGTYIAGFSGYHYGKLFTAATKKRQARLAWEEMSKFIQSDEDLAGEDIASEKDGMFAEKDYKSVIIANETHCTIEALSKESGLDDGFRAIYASIDEYHQHKTNQIYKALYNGTKSLPETLISIITTRGDKINTPCYELDNYCCNILRGIAKAEDFFVDIYALDKGDNIWDPQNLIKANEQRDFMVKSLNMWVNTADDQFTDIEKWKQCETEKTLEDMRGKQCFAGIDLSSGGDLTTISLEFPLEEEKFYIYSHSFMPRGRMDEHIDTDIAPYDLWQSEGLITVTGGVSEYKNDYKFIINHLKDLIQEYDLDLKAIGYDPHNADGFLADLEEFGVPLLQITQSARFLNDATVDMRLNIKSKKIEYDKKNELLSWSFSNAKVVKNSFGEIKIDKEPKAKTKRIDPADACIDAHVAYMKLGKDETIDIDEEMNNYLQMMNWR